MSVNGDLDSFSGYHANDHENAYIYAPSAPHVDAPERPTKRRKVAGRKSSTKANPKATGVRDFIPLLNGLESSECVALREQLFERSWAATEERIHNILNESNGGTLAEVVSFVQRDLPLEETERLPAGFIVTGPNIASQDLLFKQLSETFQTEAIGPIVTLRSGDAPYLKSTLKKLIKDATNQKATEDTEEGQILEQDGRKLLNYDLEIVHTHVKAHPSQKVIIAFQDSEAFDTILLADLIILLSSWRDRIPFVLLFGIATSVTFFHERLSRAASRCLYGAQFDVAQISSILEILFEKVIASLEARLRLESGFVSTLMERQHDHVQSIQAFVAAMKYAYMCHFYANPLSILLLDSEDGSQSMPGALQPEHLEAVRTLPSFRRHVEVLVEGGEVDRARRLLEDNNMLWIEMENSLKAKVDIIARALRAMQVLSCASSGPLKNTELYARASTGSLAGSDLLENVLDSIKKASPESLMSTTTSILEGAATGSPEFDLEAWADEDAEFVQEIKAIQDENAALVKEGSTSGNPIRSKYSVHSKAMRTTVIAKKVQLSQETATLTQQDKVFTDLIDRLVQALKEYATFDNPQELFLSEVWLYGSKSPYRDVFTPRPRAAIERALSKPHDYLGCQCCDPSTEGASLSHPPTAILYEMYLSAGSLINISDLLTAFLGAVGGEDGEDLDEREGLMLFYRALGDLKLLGLIKQSRKKMDHLVKLAWKGL